MSLFRKMKLIRIATYLLCLYSVISCKNENPKLLIAVSSNAKEAISHIAAEFEIQYDIKTEIISSSSGKLSTQIEQGAPFDLFFSADLKYPEYLLNKKIGYDSVLKYAEGRLVLWSTKLDTIPNLEADKINKIAIANPELAPYGKAAIQYLNGIGLQEKLKDKLIYGESISQTNQYILNGSVDLGFTALSIVSAPEMKSKGVWKELDGDLYSPVEQGFIILNRNKNTIQFRDFIFSSKSQKILNDFGYFTSE